MMAPSSIHYYILDLLFQCCLYINHLWLDVVLQEIWTKPVFTQPIKETGDPYIVTQFSSILWINMGSSSYNTGGLEKSNDKLLDFLI